MSTVFDTVIRHKARKLAHTHIKRAIDSLRNTGQFNFEDCQRDISDSFWQRKSINFVFSKAYEGPWYTLGEGDAQKGSKRFDVPAYLKGWRNQILSLSFDGWVNPRIIQQYGWVDETIAQQLINIKHQLDQLDWETAPHNTKNLVG